MLHPSEGLQGSVCWLLIEMSRQLLRLHLIDKGLFIHLPDSLNYLFALETIYY